MTGCSMILPQNVQCHLWFQDPDTVAQKMGIKTEKYYQNCRLVRKEADLAAN